MVTVHNWLREIVNVTDEELKVIDEITETENVKANEFILKQGEIANKIGFLVQGSVRTYYTDTNGNDKTVGFTFDGEPLAVIDSFFNHVPSSITSVAIEPSLIIWTDYERYSAFVTKFPRYHIAMLTALGHWFTEGKNRMEYLYKSSAKAKYETMCQLHPKIIERVPLKYIASYLGITQETLSRIRGKK